MKVLEVELKDALFGALDETCHTLETSYKDGMRLREPGNINGIFRSYFSMRMRSIYGRYGYHVKKFVQDIDCEFTIVDPYIELALEYKGVYTLEDYAKADVRKMVEATAPRILNLVLCGIRNPHASKVLRVDPPILVNEPKIVPIKSFEEILSPLQKFKFN